MRQRSLLHQLIMCGKFCEDIFEHTCILETAMGNVLHFHGPPTLKFMFHLWKPQLKWSRVHRDQWNASLLGQMREIAAPTSLEQVA